MHLSITRTFYLAGNWLLTVNYKVICSIFENTYSVFVINNTLKLRIVITLHAKTVRAE